MSGRDAPAGEPTPRLLVVCGGEAHDVLEVVTFGGTVAHVRSPLLFEIGEQLTVRVERGDASTEMLARVRAHGGPPDARVTELELFAAETASAS